MKNQEGDIYREKNHSEKMTSNEILAFNNYLENIKESSSYRNQIFTDKFSEEIKFQHEFQPAVIEILKKIIQIDLESLEEAVNYILERIGLCCGIDRCYIYQCYDRDRFIKNNFVWLSEKLEQKQQSSREFIRDIKAFWMEKLHNTDYLIMSDFKSRSEFSKEERILLERQNVKSLIVFPMQVEKDLFGFFGFDFISKSHSFRDYEIQALKMLTEILSGLFAKNLDYAKIKYYSFRDNLTGLYNRAFISEEIKRLDTKRQLPISIIMIDINNLKLYNDSFGHQKGDELIVKTAQILKSTFRAEDIVARWGGDEFIIFLPKTDKKTALNIITRLEERCSETHENNLPVSLSIGLALKSSSRENINKVINQADQNMYADKIKKRKKSKSIFFTRVLVNMTKNIVGKFLAGAFLSLLV